MPNNESLRLNLLRFGSELIVMGNHSDLLSNVAILYVFFYNIASWTFFKNLYSKRSLLIEITQGIRYDFIHIFHTDDLRAYDVNFYQNIEKIYPHLNKQLTCRKNSTINPLTPSVLF